MDIFHVAFDKFATDVKKILKRSLPALNCRFIFLSSSAEEVMRWSTFCQLKHRSAVTLMCALQLHSVHHLIYHLRSVFSRISYLL